MELRYHVRKLIPTAICMAACALLFAFYSLAQVQLPPSVKTQFFDANGRPLAGGCVFSFQSGTNTPLATYTDFTGGTPNPNPIVLGSDGRPPNDIWLLGQAYRLQLVSAGGVSCASGNQIWVEDGINPSSGSVLASNNTWTGVNTWQATSNFNGPVNFNVGFTSLGPNTLGGGGSISGTWSGSPTFSGVLVINGGMTFLVPWTSLVTTGTAPFTISSATEVANLNANFLQGFTWGSPSAIGFTTPAGGTFTGLVAQTSLTTPNLSLNGSTVQTGVQGTDTNLLSAGVSTGATGVVWCKDANGGATTVGCSGGGFSRISTGTNSSVCTTGTSAGATCPTTVTITPTQADTSYIPSCQGITLTGAPYIADVHSLTTSSIIVTISNGQGSQAVASTYATLACSAIHP